MSPAPNEWDLARRLDTLSLNIGRHPGGFLVVFLVTSYSSVSPSAPPSLHNSVYFNAWFHISGSHLFMAAKPPQTGQGCDTAGAVALGWVCLQWLFSAGRRNPPFYHQSREAAAKLLDTSGRIKTHLSLILPSEGQVRPEPRQARAPCVCTRSGRALAVRRCSNG